jgi:hypothetical protein
VTIHGPLAITDLQRINAPVQCHLEEIGTEIGGMDPGVDLRVLHLGSETGIEMDHRPHHAEWKGRGKKKK